MRQVIVCECGTIVRGDDERELLSNARAHMRANHPAIAGHITDEQLHALSQEEPTPQAVARDEAQSDP
jgi:predicted small metal-binding protein